MQCGEFSAPPMFMQHVVGIAMDREGGKSREVKKLGAASIMLDLIPEDSSGRTQRYSSRDFPSRHELGITPQYGLLEREGRSRLSRPKRHEMQFVNSTIGGIGSTGGGGGGGGRENIIFAESAVAPGVPVVYRTPEERTTNPDRLNLDRRHLTICPILEGEEHLRLLNLQHNAITRLQHLGSLRRLVFLDLYDNLISEISGLEGLHSLRVLMLGRNRINSIYGLQSLTRLDVLDLHGNMIREIDNLSHLTHLRVLNLAGNDITVVRGLTGLASLAELNLRRNRITHCEIDELPNLQRLFMSHNLIESIEDVSSLVHCPLLIDLSVDGNPLANNSDHRSLLLSQLSQLVTLSQHPVTEEERSEATRAAQKEERKIKVMHKRVKLIEERDSAVALIKKEWEMCEKQEKKSTSCHIEEEGDGMCLYGTGSLEALQSTRLPSITHIHLNYINFNDICFQLLPHFKNTLPNVKSLELNSVNICTLLQLQTLSRSLPPTLTSLTITHDGNPVTSHPLYTSWSRHLMPHIQLGGIEEHKGTLEDRHIFNPLATLHATAGASEGMITEDELQSAKGFSEKILQHILIQHRKSEEFEKMWPDLVKSLIQEAIDWTDTTLHNMS